MFRTKGRAEEMAEQLQAQSDSLADTAAAVADQLRERVVPAVGQATENAMEWARPHFEHGVEVAAPKLESAVYGLSPKVDTARDKIVEELIPRLAEAISAWAAATTAAKDEAVSRGKGAASVISGDAVASPKGRKRRLLLVLGLMAGAVAAAMTVMKKSAPKDDPWTTPLADRYEAVPNGRHSATSQVKEAKDHATRAGSTATHETIERLDETGSTKPMDLAKDIDITAKDDANKREPNKDDTKKSGANQSGTHKNGAEKDPPA